MSEEIKRPGYLRYKCDCGALIKVDCDDAARELIGRTYPNPLYLYVHECDPLRMGIAKLIGCTFSDEPTKYCPTNTE